MKSIKFIFLFMIVFTITSQSITFARYLSRTDRNNIANKCMQETGIEENVIANAVKSTVIPEDNEKYKEFLHCSYMGQGYQTKNGDIIHNEIKEFLAGLNIYQKYDVDFIVDNCVGIKGETPGDVAVQTVKCLIKNMKELEKNNEIDDDD